MNKADYKLFQRELERKEQLAKALSSSRHVDDDIGCSDFGTRLLQIVYRPSFEPTRVWEIRQQDDDYTVFEALMHKTDWYTIAPGYKQLGVPSDTLKYHLDRCNSLAVPIAMPCTNTYGLDGNMYELALFGTQCSLRVVWHEEPHEAWAELAAYTREAIDVLKMAGKR